MKNPSVSLSRRLLFPALLLALTTGTHSLAKGQQLFSSASISQKNGHSLLQFTVCREVNVFQYRIEAGDSLHFEVAATLSPRGNSLFARDYSYELFDTDHAFYRIAAVHMGGSGVEYSGVLSSAVHSPVTEPFPIPRPGIKSRVIASRKHPKTAE